LKRKFLVRTTLLMFFIMVRLDTRSVRVRWKVTDDG
jgi:hypothetical protein